MAFLLEGDEQEKMINKIITNINLYMPVMKLTHYGYMCFDAVECGVNNS